MEIKIPYKTPSVNHLYGQRGFRRFLTKEGQELKAKIIVATKEQTPYFAGAIGELQVEVEIHEDWYTKNMDIARKDVANREKFLIDSVFEALEIDDKLIFKHTLKKIQDTEEFALIKIEDFRRDG